jgi:isoamylase
LAFTRELINLRKSHPIFCRRRWFKGHLIKEADVKDIDWFLPDGTEMTEENWNSGFAKSLGVYLNGTDLGIGAKGEKVTDDNFYIIFNADHNPLEYQLPHVKHGKKWTEVINTKNGAVTKNGTVYKPGEKVTAEGRSVVLLQSHR